MRNLVVVLAVTFLAACGGVVASAGPPEVSAQSTESGVHLTDAQAASCRAAFRQVGGFATEMIVFGYQDGVTEPRAWSIYADQRVRAFGDAFNRAAVDCPLTSS